MASCGTAAAAYFRVFKPILQGEKFNTDGQYITRYVAELKDLPDKHLHKPWDTPTEVLEQGVSPWLKASRNLSSTRKRQENKHWLYLKH
jgi:deoxyribodipyrimidine photolyase